MKNKNHLKLILIIGGVLTVPFFIALSVSAARLVLTDNLKISNTLFKATNPDIVWTGQNYGLAWSDQRNSQDEPEIYFTKLNEFGERVVRETKISDSSDKISDEPAIVWADNLYAVAWSEYYQDEAKNKQEGCGLYMSRLDKEGKEHGGIIPITSDKYGSCPIHPSIAWSGFNYGIAWHESRADVQDSQIYFIKFNSLGQRQTNEIQISEMANSKNPSLFWTGSDYGLVWQSEGEIYFTRLDADGNKKEKDIIISDGNGTSSNPDLVWGDSAYGVVWQGHDEEDQQQILFVQLNEEGSKKTEIVTVSNNQDEEYSNNPSIVWRKDEYGISWQQEEDQIFFAAFDHSGRKKGRILKISDNNSQAIDPALALGVSRYGLAWQDSRGNNQEIYFAGLPFSEIDSTSQLLAFIKDLNGNSWIILLIVAAGVLIILLLIYLVRKKK